MFTSDTHWGWDLLAKTGNWKFGPKLVSHTPVTEVAKDNPQEDAVLALQRAGLSFCILRGHLLLAGRSRNPCKRDSAFHFVRDLNTVGFITFLLALLRGC